MQDDEQVKILSVTVDRASLIAVFQSGIRTAAAPIDIIARQIKNPPTDNPQFLKDAHRRLSAARTKLEFFQTALDEIAAKPSDEPVVITPYDRTRTTTENVIRMLFPPKIDPTGKVY